jgi:hypothetical protein|tara:strand:+ start:1041 stop:1319 length:279 start_codon:yes stop_codon:yes gene_type:complete
VAIADSKKWKSVTRYQPGPPPLNPQDIPIYLTNELNRIGEVIFNLSNLRLEEAFVVPDKPRNGQLEYADGTDWNPGAGVGIYWFNGSSWTKL